MAYKFSEYDAEDFLLEALREGSLTDAEARKAYSQMRKVANERLEALGQSKYNKSQAYLKNVGKYTALSTIPKSSNPEKPSRELAYKLADLYKFVNSKSGSVTGQREIEKKALETAHERGLTFLNKGNLKEFGEFMEEARQKGYSKIYGSERVMEMFRTATKKGIKPDEVMEDFNYFMDNKAELDKMPKIRNAEERTAENYRQKLENGR